MYIHKLEAHEFRCFEYLSLDFQYPGRKRGSHPTPNLPNVNLILGDNGAGKSSVLMAIALGVLKDTLKGSGYRPYYLVRRNQGKSPISEPIIDSTLNVDMVLHEQDSSQFLGVDARITLARCHVIITHINSYEDISGSGNTMPPSYFGEITKDDSSSLFLLGYGTSRRAENTENFDSSTRNKQYSKRFQRVAGLFYDYMSLTPVQEWFRELVLRERQQEGVALLNRLLPESVQLLEPDRPYDEPRFAVRGTPLPFGALSDGFRGFIGWAGDMLYHLCQLTPEGSKMTDMRGVVMVDEVDLLLHPEWQRTIIESLATTFPNLQFFFTSHSPLLAGALQADNLFITEFDSETNSIKVVQGEQNVYGLSADQILTSSYFGLSTPRAPGAVEDMKELARKAGSDNGANALELMRRLTKGF